MAKCLDDCLCMSFQLCEHKRCQLCSSSSSQSPSALREQKGCVHYDVERSAIQSDQCTGDSCLASINCCRTSQPCLHGGKCKSVSSADLTARFTCKCLAGFAGKRCENQVRSCRGYIDGKPKSPGIYKIFDNKTQLLDVICDFNTAGDRAWTLIQSFQLQSKSQFEHSFFTDSPIDENTPSMTEYRLSKAKMESIQSDSKKWRITCNYDLSARINHQDSVKGSIRDLDILTFNGQRCVNVSYINIYGQVCHDCTAFFMQAHNTDHVGYLCSFHSDSSQDDARKCSFQQNTTREFCLGGGYEDNFGYYYCTNPKHLCTKTQTSTTQTWFGGMH